MLYPSINVDPDLLYEFGRIEKQIKDSLLFKAKNKFVSIISPKCFDRTFTFLVNEDDFELTDSLGDYSEQIGNYTILPIKNISAELNIANSANYENENEISKSVLTHKEIINNNNKVSNISNYYCNVSIIKDIPDLN